MRFTTQLTLTTVGCFLTSCGPNTSGPIDEVDERPAITIAPASDLVPVARGGDVTSSDLEYGEIDGLSVDAVQESDKEQGASGPESGRLVNLDMGGHEIHLSSTPGPIYQFDTAPLVSTGGFPADANVAASRTHVCITARAAFACYTKDGTAVSPGFGLSAGLNSAATFFTLSGIPIAPPPPASGGTFTKDGRVVFDQYRRRFFMVFQSREAPVNRILIATSKSEDPRDGWFTAVDALPPNEPLHDYQKLGVNQNFLLVSDNVLAPGGTRTRHIMYPTANLINGITVIPIEWSTPLANGAAPCVHETTTPHAYWVSRDDDTHATVWGYNAFTGTIVQSAPIVLQTSQDPVDAPQLDDSNNPAAAPAIVFTNIGRTPQNAVFRNNRIVWASNDGHIWGGQQTVNSAVRLVRFNVANFFLCTFFPLVCSPPVEIDRIFGRSAPGEPETTIFDYGWPAVSTNSLGDIVVGSVRTHSSIYPEQRASVWFAGHSDIEGSVSIAPGQATYEFGVYDMAGASADPSTNAVYLAQLYPIPNDFRVRVTKMLGTRRADLISPSITVPPTMNAGSTYIAAVTVMNQGDFTTRLCFPTPCPLKGKLWLSTDDFIFPTPPGFPPLFDRELAEFEIPGVLVPGQSKVILVGFQIPSSQAPGTYYVGTSLDTTGVETEYSETNNVNPFLAAPRGNAQTTIQ